MKAFISRRDFLKAAGITAAAAALAGCSSSGGSASGSSAGGKTIKIGVFEPASGDNGAGGKQEVLGVEPTPADLIASGLGNIAHAEAGQQRADNHYRAA